MNDDLDILDEEDTWRDFVETVISRKRPGFWGIFCETDRNAIFELDRFYILFNRLKDDLTFDVNFRNKHTLEFSNGTRVMAGISRPGSIRGYSFNGVLVKGVPRNKDFWNAVWPALWSRKPPVNVWKIKA